MFFEYRKPHIYELGSALPSLPQPIGNYVPFVIGVGSLAENVSVEIEAMVEVP